VRHEVKGVIAVGCKSIAGEVAVDPLWKHLSRNFLLLER